MNAAVGLAQSASSSVFSNVIHLASLSGSCSDHLSIIYNSPCVELLTYLLEESRVPSMMQPLGLRTCKVGPVGRQRVQSFARRRLAYTAEP